MRTPSRSRARRQGGAASVEALILLPFFFIVWAGLYFTYRMVERRVVIDEKERSCTWQQMSGSCTAPVAAGCSFSAPPPQLGDDDLAGARASVENIDTRLGTPFNIDLRGMFGPIFRELFGSERESQVGRPPGLGGGEATVRTGFSAMCNEQPSTASIDELSRTAFCAIQGC